MRQFEFDISDFLNNLRSGSEMLKFQGLHVEEFDTPMTESEKLLGDLAGNAFASGCILAAIFGLLGALRYESDSEDEQLSEISNAFKAIGMVNQLAKEDQ